MPSKPGRKAGLPRRPVGLPAPFMDNQLDKVRTMLRERDFGEEPSWPEVIIYLYQYWAEREEASQ